MSADTRVHEEIEIRRRAKRALRNQMRAVRAALPESACDARSAAITNRLLGLEELARAQTVLCFASIGNEVRTGTFISAMWDAGKRVVLPRVVEDELELCLVDGATALVEGAFSVPEPDRNAPLLPAEEVDFALVPALAVDPRGFRIGYGGGYYDRLLPRLSRACSCAVAYDFQVISEVPELPFDAAVALVVTDRRVIRAK
ncbi:MAG: 5-formyltetrahydrofolate cyclo-ligase [Polyangiales bacterium]